jgi:hypothetical protein
LSVKLYRHKVIKGTLRCFINSQPLEQKTSFVINTDINGLYFNSLVSHDVKLNLVFNKAIDVREKWIDQVKVSNQQQALSFIIRNEANEVNF